MPKSLQLETGLWRYYARHPLQYLRFLHSQRVRGFPVSSEPGLDEGAEALFNRLLGDCSSYLEFGSGGSTLLADRMGVRTVSVESDRFYARSVRRALGQHTSVQVLVVDIGLTGQWSYPLFSRPTARRIRRWSRYVDRPFELLESQHWFPELVLVDGRFRRACVLQTARAAWLSGRQVAILVDDYFVAGREHYRAVERWLGAPERAGRAALFRVVSGSGELPSDQDIAQAVRDFR